MTGTTLDEIAGDVKRLNQEIRQLKDEALAADREEHDRLDERVDALKKQRDEVAQQAANFQASSADGALLQIELVRNALRSLLATCKDEAYSSAARIEMEASRLLYSISCYVGDPTDVELD